MSNIYVLGTPHISIESIKEVKSTFKEFNPDIIALELDPLRFQALLARKQKRSITKEIQFFGIKGFLLTLVLGYIEKKLGQKVKIKPGTEMLTAIKLAKQLGPGKTIVTILCDHGRRYASKIFNKEFLKSKNLPIPKWL